MTSLSAKTPFEQIVNYYWSNRFSTENNTLIHHDFNQAIRARIDVNDFSYKKNQQALIHLLRNKDICAYQSALLAWYFREPEKHLDLDVDYLSLNFDCNNNAAVEKLLSARGLVKARNKAEAKVLKVSCESGVGHVNVNTDKETGVIYTHRFSLALFGNLYKRIQLYISDGSKGNGSIEFRIDLIPSKFTDFELQIFFSHIKSNVGARPFEQLMNKATFSRVDIGFNLPGLSQLFLYPNHKKNKRVTSGESLPENCLAETTYLGDRIRSNFFILYDKILKEAKFHHRRHGSPLAEKKSFVEKLAVTSRVERRYRPRRDGNKKALPISSLPDVNISFKPLAFFNPKILPFLSDKELKRLLKDKSITGSYAGKPHYQPLTKTSRKEKKTPITLNSQWFDNAKKELAQSLLDTIRKPKSFSSSELESFNK